MKRCKWLSLLELLRHWSDLISDLHGLGRVQNENVFAQPTPPRKSKWFCLHFQQTQNKKWNEMFLCHLPSKPVLYKIIERSNFSSSYPPTTHPPTPKTKQKKFWKFACYQSDHSLCHVMTFISGNCECNFELNQFSSEVYLGKEVHHPIIVGKNVYIHCREEGCIRSYIPGDRGRRAY